MSKGLDGSSLPALLTAHLCPAGSSLCLQLSLVDVSQHLGVSTPIQASHSQLYTKTSSSEVLQAGTPLPQAFFLNHGGKFQADLFLMYYL